MVEIKHFNASGLVVGKQTTGASGYDLYNLEDRTIMPGETHVIGTGSHFEIPNGFEGQVTLRSSYGKRGVVIPNAPGIIDSDYRGEVKVILSNISRVPVEMPAGHRFAQIRFTKVPVVHILNVESLNNLDETARGNGGFGSTGNA